ncbi:MAG: hypothetical protein IID44_09820 [Planctomycetes bacterium]|nr:hypothetical protein [Planctomycetota bacterium]
MFITIFWLSIGLGIFSWAYWSEWRDSAKRIRSINSAVARNIASVVRIRSEEMIEFEEHEDEGACYAFQLDDDRIVFVSGQEFYRTARFPSTDFELIDIADEAGNLAETRIVKHGEPLAPVRTIASADARDLSIPFHLSVVSGRLEDIERILTTQS